MVTCVQCQEGKLPRLRIDSLENPDQCHHNDDHPHHPNDEHHRHHKDMPIVCRGSFVVTIVTGDVIALVGTATQLHW